MLQPYVDKHQSIVCVYVTMYERVGQISKAKTSKALNNIADFVKNCKITQHKLHARYSELQEQIKALDMFTGQHCNVQCVTDRWYVSLYVFYYLVLNSLYAAVVFVNPTYVCKKYVDIASRYFSRPLWI